jgi:hypothetical protein
VLSENKILNETKNHNPPFKLNGRTLRGIEFAPFYNFSIRILDPYNCGIFSSSIWYLLQNQIQEFDLLICIVNIIIYLSIILWKESLNNDGHQFHQYQQNKQSPSLILQKRKFKQVMAINSNKTNNRLSS